MTVDPKLSAYAHMINALHARWTPHSGQVPVGQAYFRDGKTSLFVQCGRKWGKTELALYFLWRIAKTFPGAPCYYIAPLQKQAREIIWANPRLVNFGPREWLLEGNRGVSEAEMRLRFANGSFIKLDGSDNWDSYRGPEFKVCVYEEYKDMDPRFRGAMSPNAAVLNGLELFIGTPPDRECEYVELAKEHQLDPAKFFFQAPTWQNPKIAREWLQKKKAELYRKGEGDQWEREYEAKYVKGGAAKIFPMISEKIVRPHAEVVKEIERDRKKLHWFWWADPAAASCFAVLLLAINPFNKKIYVLDEIYETDQGKMSVRQIGKEITAKRDELWARGEWREGYDEAEKWFQSEWIDNFPEENGLEPSHKAKNDKDSGLSLIKDILLGSHLVISDRAAKFFWELDNYFKDKNGRIPKVNDHLIDCFRYILGAEGYELKGETEYRESEDENFRGEALRAPVSDFDADGAGADWEDYS